MIPSDELGRKTVESVRKPTATADPLETLSDTLERAWKTLCKTFDTCADLPDMSELFDGADLNSPSRAARSVIVNMLLEIMESASRFSPWYKMPARAYGLTSDTSISGGNQVPTRFHQLQSGAHPNKPLWTLAPEANQRWQKLVEDLAFSIRKSSGLIQATLLVNGLMATTGYFAEDDPEITVCCNCLPPRVLHVRRSVLEQADIWCEACNHPFC